MRFPLVVIIYYLKIKNALEEKHYIIEFKSAFNFGEKSKLLKREELR